MQVQARQGHRRCLGWQVTGNGVIAEQGGRLTGADNSAHTPGKGSHVHAKLEWSRGHARERMGGQARARAITRSGQYSQAFGIPQNVTGITRACCLERETGRTQLKGSGRGKGADTIKEASRGWGSSHGMGWPGVQTRIGRLHGGWLDIND